MPDIWSSISPFIRRAGPASLKAQIHSRRLTIGAASFLESVPKVRQQVYVSRSHDPYVNLSIEHYLLQHTSQDSTILFLYINRPCIVIGRNQNPWLETNLSLLEKPVPLSIWSDEGGAAKRDLTVDVVRRRSGGGAVFHDHGNVNYCVICPTQDFTRDKHAEMVVRAIRRNNLRARVNERHDIVLDQGDLLPENDRPLSTDTHKTMYALDGRTPLKISGSAYKLTRGRSLHHGTCLVNSPNIKEISMLLRSPAAPFIKARGVDSVRSPVSNLHLSYEPKAVADFMSAVIDEFINLHSLNRSFVNDSMNEPGVHDLGEDIATIDKLQVGIQELKSQEWRFTQTPQFTFASHPSEEDDRARPSLPDGLPDSTRVLIRARSGIIESTQISFSKRQQVAREQAAKIDAVLKGRKIHEITDFGSIIHQACKDEDGAALANWLNIMFGSI